MNTTTLSDDIKVCRVVYPPTTGWGSLSPGGDEHGPRILYQGQLRLIHGGDLVRLNGRWHHIPLEQYGSIAAEAMDHREPDGSWGYEVLALPPREWTP